MQRHRLSDIFGDISGEAYNALRVDIAHNGFMNAEILTYEGHILDGWHRYCIAKELDMVKNLVFVDITGGGIDPVMRVLSNNLHRRHLNASQRAQIAVEANEWYERGGDRRSDGFNAPNGAKKTKKELAEMAGVGTSTIDRAKKVSRAGFAGEVISGEKPASEIITEEKAKDTPRQREDLANNPFPEGFYPTIVIDLSTETIEKLGIIEPPLVDDALVFVWATRKNVPDPFKLIEAWGLTYFFIMGGHKAEGIKGYNSTQFNDVFILIGAKGNFSLSTVDKLATAFQAERDKHAMNLDMFYDIVRRVTDPQRLAIYSRTEIDGFDVWERKVSSGYETGLLSFSM